MNKGLLSLYVDRNLVEIAKSKKINLSQCFNAFIATELQLSELPDSITKDELIENLKVRLSNSTTQMNLLNDKIQILERENKELSKKLEKAKSKHKEDSGTWLMKPIR